MKKFWLGLLGAVMIVFLLAACGGETNNNAKQHVDNDQETTNTANQETNDSALQVVTSFTIIEDLAHQIGGDDVEIHNLVPTGTDPHEYEPLPEDIKKATDADILFYNGLNLEGGESGWFLKMIDAVNQDEDNVFSLTERVEPMYLSGEDGKVEEMNPHAFIDPAVGIKMAEDMRDALVEIDPDNKENYEERATTYLERLDEVDKEYEEKINRIPEENRTLVTSERAYQYMADHYGLNEAFIWEVDTEENGTPEQIKSLTSYIEEKEVPVLFVESNVDARPMETVSSETGVPIFDEPIYSDEIGEPGTIVDTYMKYLNYNIKVIYDGLTGD